MSLSTTTNRSDRTLNGVATVFAFDFKVFAETDLEVIHIDQTTEVETVLTLGVDYTVSGVNADAGSVTLVTGPGTSGDRLIIKRVMNLVQPTRLRNQGDFFPATHERAFDRSIMIDQQQQEEIDRSFKLNTGASGGVTVTPVPGYALGFDALGNLGVVPNTAADQTLAWTAADAIVAANASADTALVRSDLASTAIGKGAEVVGYLAPYTGAVGRTLGEKSAEWASPEDFGAAGDGVTDDTTALKKWISSGGPLVLVGGKTYIVSPVNTGDIILPLSAPVTIIGDFSCTIKVKDSSLEFTSILGSNDTGVDLSGTAVIGVIFDHNKANNTYSATANVLNHAHVTFMARNGANIKFNGNQILDPVCTNSVYINGVSSGVALVINPEVIGNRFYRVGGSATTHDHSTIYIAGDGGEVYDNLAWADSLGATGTACFIEMHGTKFGVNRNKCYDFIGFANITGIYSGGDTEFSTVYGNSCVVQRFGIRLFSTALSPHTTGYGINNLNVRGNSINILQTNIPAGSTNVYPAIAFQSGSTLPSKNVVIEGNTIVYQLEAVAPSYTAVSCAIGVNEASNNAVFENIEINNNTIINAPCMAIALGIGNGTFLNCSIGANRIINPGQTLVAALVSYKVALWLGANTYSGKLDVGRLTIEDTNATTRMVHAVYAAPTADSTACNMVFDYSIFMTGDKVLFNRFFANVGNFTYPIVNVVMNDPPSFSAYNFRANSKVLDTTTQITYRVFVDGQTWTSHGYASAAPVSGSWTVGSTRTNTAPASAGYIGWVCTVAGSPGTWKGYGLIA